MPISTHRFNKPFWAELFRFIVVGLYTTLIDLAVEGWATSFVNVKGSNHIVAFLLQFLIATFGFVVSSPASWSLTSVWGFRNADEKKTKSFKGFLRFVFWAFLALLGGSIIHFLGYMTCLEWTGWGIDILNDFSFSKIASGDKKVLWCFLVVFVIRTAFTMVFNYLTRKYILYKPVDQSK